MPDQNDALFEALKLIETSLDPQDVKTKNVVRLAIDEAEKLRLGQQETEELLSKYEQAYEKLTKPANRIGTFCELREDGTASIFLGDNPYIVNIDPMVKAYELQKGDSVVLNEGYAIVGRIGTSTTGEIVAVTEVLENGRLKVGGDLQGLGGRIIQLSAGLQSAELKAGDDVRLDTSGQFAVEHIAKKSAREHFIEVVPPIGWDEIGGQEEAVTLIRETLEHPLLYPELFAAFEKKPIKGVLLYGPPGCGKTLIGKAVAHNLAREYSEKTGKEIKDVFLSISGPKILNMWLGETERQVREVFSAAREQAAKGNLVVVFIDEAESLLRTRSSGRWHNISNTVVPQFCAEMDGLVGLENVVIILTSNRPDYIDPAILRPERIDRKVKISRPNRQSSLEILGIYLKSSLPLDKELLAQWDNEPDCARKSLVENAIDFLWSEKKETEFLTIMLRNGSRKQLYWHDFVSGALLKSVVDRAKDFAIKRSIADKGNPSGISLADLELAIATEFRENEIFPQSDATEDWLRLLDHEPDQIAAVIPSKKVDEKTKARSPLI